MPRFNRMVVNGAISDRNIFRHSVFVQVKCLQATNTKKYLLLKPHRLPCDAIYNMKKMVFGIALILFGLSMAYLSLQADWAIMQALSILPVFIGLVFQFLDLMRKINKPVIVEPMMKGGSILINAPAFGC